MYLLMVLFFLIFSPLRKPFNPCAFFEFTQYVQDQTRIHAIEFFQKISAELAKSLPAKQQHKYVHNIYMITTTYVGTYVILNGCSVFPSLKASLLDNKPNYLGGCVIQKRNTTYLIPLQLYWCKVRSGL